MYQNEIALAIIIFIIIPAICLISFISLTYKIITHRNELKRLIKESQGEYYDDSMRLYKSHYNSYFISFRSDKNNGIFHACMIAEKAGLYNSPDIDCLYLYDRRKKRLYITKKSPITYESIEFDYVKESKDKNGRMSIVKLSTGEELKFCSHDV